MKWMIQKNKKKGIYLQFVLHYLPCILRGGHWTDGISSSVFAFFRTDGELNSSISFRDIYYDFHNKQFVNRNCPWFICGGPLPNGTEVGVFAFGAAYGHSALNASFRWYFTKINQI